MRLLRNALAQQAQALEAAGASADTLAELLGRGRSRRGMFEGDLEAGELEIGQVSALIGDIVPAAEVLARLEAEYAAALGGC